MVKVLYDFKFETDITLVKLHIGMSYLQHFLPSATYICVDATKGSGKTTLLEIISLLKYHGFMAGDISPAALARYVDEHALNIAVDELDQKVGEKGDQEIVSILRKGQRRGDPYVRCQGKNFVPKPYDVFGIHAFSIRSETEDALRQRAFDIHASESKDNRLPILNMVKENILSSLMDTLFIWYIENAVKIGVECSKLGVGSELCGLDYFNLLHDLSTECSGVGGKNATLTEGVITDDRKTLYDNLTKGMKQPELELLAKLGGRNAELTYASLQVARLLGLDVIADLAKVSETKQADEGAGENFYFDMD